MNLIGQATSIHSLHRGTSGEPLVDAHSPFVDLCISLAFFANPLLIKTSILTLISLLHPSSRNEQRDENEYTFLTLYTVVFASTVLWGGCGACAQRTIEL